MRPFYRAERAPITLQEEMPRLLDLLRPRAYSRFSRRAGSCQEGMEAVIAWASDCACRLLAEPSCCEPSRVTLGMACGEAGRLDACLNSS